MRPSGQMRKPINRRQLSGPNDGPIQTENATKLSERELARRVAYVLDFVSRGTLSQREKVTGRAFDLQFGLTKRIPRYRRPRVVIRGISGQNSCVNLLIRATVTSQRLGLYSNLPAARPKICQRREDSYVAWYQ